MFYVESLYYDNGNVDAFIWTEEEAEANGIDLTPFKELKNCDRYVEEFETLEEAEEEVEEVYNA